MDQRSAEKLAKVHPVLAYRVQKLIERLTFLDVRVVQGLRSYAEQDLLYAQGRTLKGDVVTNARGGFSNHNFGLAVDLCPFTDGKPAWDDASGFDLIGKAAVQVGLLWGGNWKKFKDRPHVEINGPDLALCRSLYIRGGLSLIWQKASDMNETPIVKETPVIKEKPPVLIKKGNYGLVVGVIQQKLKDLGYLKSSVDEIFGKNMESAVMQFQSDNGLRPDGIIGELTFNKLGVAK